jgi:hypothetical protein
MYAWNMIFIKSFQVVWMIIKTEAHLDSEEETFRNVMVVIYFLWLMILTIQLLKWSRNSLRYYPNIAWRDWEKPWNNP